ncbi:MAG: ANTAR domain-containing protein [Rhodospirillum sp.]|nr:ANTAR domain-containing protein [Rhodospirillum sp.]MCF8488367.1 ANTAR domain-containing protein [Rhodospirillum sp.]MCF8500623.1 ANTAR domain-containing protein [Rhodospirillum sp.]
MSGEDLSILVIDINPSRAAVVEAGLAAAGHTRVVTLNATTNLAARIEALAPDVIVIDLENPDRDTLEQMFQVTRAVQRPIAMFVDHSDTASIRAAMEAGVSAYVVDGLRKERVQAVLETAVSRFRTFDRLRKERDEAVTALADRKIIDRAKGILMKSKGWAEDEAYTALRKNAMTHNRKIVDVAQSVITAFEMDL